MFYKGVLYKLGIGAARRFLATAEDSTILVPFSRLAQPLVRLSSSKRGIPIEWRMITIPDNITLYRWLALRVCGQPSRTSRAARLASRAALRLPSQAAMMDPFISMCHTCANCSGSRSLESCASA